MPLILLKLKGIHVDGDIEGRFIVALSFGLG